MNRRDALFAILALGALPFATRAQQRVSRIGFLTLDSSTSVAGQQALDKLPEALGRLGYQVGRNLIVEWRWAEGQQDKLQAFAQELVRLRVDLIVARTTIPIVAANKATHTIPIVMFNGTYPVEMGLVESLSRPGANITGTSYSSLEIVEKQLQFLKEAAPKVVRLACFQDTNPASRQLKEIRGEALQRAANRLGMTLHAFDISRPAEMSAVLDKIAASRIDALFYDGQPLVRERLDEIVAFLLARKLPSVGATPGFAEHGGLLSYAPNAEDFYDRTASYVDRILKGAKPADLPVEQPTRFDLVINLKTAKALGIKIPQSVFALANRVIE